MASKLAGLAIESIAYLQLRPGDSPLSPSYNPRDDEVRLNSARDHAAMLAVYGSVGGWIAGALATAAIIALAAWGAMRRRSRTSALRAAVSTLPDFTASRYYLGCDAQTAFAVDEQAHRFCLVTAGEPAVATGFDGGDLLEVELVEDELVVAKSTRMNRLSEPISKAETPPNDRPSPRSRVREIALRFTVEAPQHAAHTVRFWNHEIERTDAKYARIMHEARSWHHLFSGLIEQTKRLRTAPPSINGDLSGTVSVADELQRLLQLYRDGVLTEVEFADQKSLLLGRSSLPHS